MPTQAEVARFADANRRIRQLVLAALRRLWSSLDPSEPRQVRDTLSEALPLLVEQYGDVAATVAADFYDQVREEAGVGGSFTALLAPGPSVEEIQQAVRWGIGPLFAFPPTREDFDDVEDPAEVDALLDAALARHAERPARALGRLEVVTDRLTLQTGRDTITQSSRRDPAKPRWARVPNGDTCAFCLMIASRGAVFTEETASNDGDRYHGKCDCTPVPIYPNQPLPEGYDPDELYEQYNEARKRAKSDRGSESTKDILAELRDETSGH